MVASRVSKVVELARRKGLLRPRDLAEVGIAREYLRLAVERGLLERVARGLYRPVGATVSEHVSLAEVCKKAPSGVICLLSALSFHELTTQLPRAVWLAVGPRARVPAIETVGLEVVRFSGRALTAGVETHDIGGVEARVFGAAKTVADCFKCRSRIGPDVAIEALRDALGQRKAAVDDLVRYGRICRVAEVMRPYVEAMLA